MKQTLPLSTSVHLDTDKKFCNLIKWKINIQQWDWCQPLFFVAVWFEAKSGQSLQVTCFDPGMQNHVFASPPSSRHCTAFWAMFSGVLLPEYPCKYPTDSSSTARPPAFDWLEKAMVHWRKGERHHRLDYCETAPCWTRAASAAISQISQTQLLYPWLLA